MLGDWREGQRVLERHEKAVRMMGSRTDRKMSRIAQEH